MRLESPTHLNALVRTQVKIELSGMRDSSVDCRTGGNVSRFSRLFLFVRAEKSGVMTLLDYDKGDTGLVIRFQFDARLANSGQFVL